MFPYCDVRLVRLMPGWNKDDLVQIEVSCHLARGDEVTVMNGVKRPTHDADSSAGAFDGHVRPSGVRIRSSRDEGCDEQRRD